MDKSKNPKIFVIILNYNGKNTLSKCLSSVFGSNYQNFEVVVVDNDSRDGSFEKARAQFSRAHFIKNSSNIGFAKGNNIGIRFALEKFADFVFILNNDAAIKKNTLSKLIETSFQDHSAGIISPIIYSGKNRDIWFAGGKVNWLKMRTQHLYIQKQAAAYSSEYITGCAMFVKKEVFKKIGLFDERFFLYYEDADFSLRAKNAGFKLLVDPTISVFHQEQSNHSNPAKIYWLVLSGLLFFKTHASFSKKIWLYFYINLRKLKNFHDLRFTPNNNAKNVRRAYIDYKKISQ